MSWFPKDLIDRYNGTVDITGPNDDQLFFPDGVADAIAEELRARGHSVERAETGDLSEWIDIVGVY